jgi:hypothetical protein
MNRIVYLFILGIVLAGCGSSKKQLERGNYDAAIDKSVKQLMKNPKSEKDIQVLDRAYQIANEQDLERIKELKLQGNPNDWDEILNRYANLKSRQTQVRTVLPLKLGNRTINYEYVDYDRQIVESKNKACEFFYNHGKKLMEENTKDGYRQAYYEFRKVKSYMGDYLDVDQLMAESHDKGMSRVLIMMQNNTQLKFPPEYEQELLAISPADINTEWVEYHTRHLNDETVYDYYVYVNMNVINVSPDNVKETDRMVNTKVSDGFDYALDAKGNVMKDTAGNDIKIPRYKTLTCTVIETYQQKSASVTGDVEIIQVNPERVLRKDPIGAESVFELRSARAVGDKNALSPEDQKLVSTEKIPFPDDFEMVYRSTETLKNAIRDIIYRNRQFIQ